VDDNIKYQSLDLFTVPPHFRGKPTWLVQLWWITDSLFFKTSPQFLYGWRRFLLRIFGARIGKKVLIRPTTRITYPWKLFIGDYAWVGDDVALYNLGDIHIGANAVVSQKSYLCAGSHDYKDKSFPIYSAIITIEEQCWLGTDVYVGPGVTIGKGTIVAARSSVFKNLPGGKIFAGTPAKQIKDRL
jgi:putative colanic acid biosynthesis acetyltransferase WcaF